MANHFIFVIDYPENYDENIANAFSESVRMFSKASFSLGKAPILVSIISIKSNGKVIVVMNEKVSKTNTVCLNVMKKSRVSEHKRDKRTGHLDVLKALKIASRLALKGRRYIPALVMFLFRDISFSSVITSKLNSMDEDFSTIALYSSYSCKQCTASGKNRMTGIYQTYLFRESRFSIRTCFKQLISDFLLPAIFLKLDFGTVMAYTPVSQAILDDSEVNEFAHTADGNADNAANVLWKDYKSTRQKGMSLRLTTVKLVSNASISPEVVLGCPFIVVPNLDSDDFDLTERNNNRICMIQETLMQHNRSLVLRYTPQHLGNATQSNKNRKDGMETRKGALDEACYYYILSPARHSQSVCYLYPLVNVQTLLPMKQISKGISYDKTDRVAQDECDSFFLALPNVGEFNPFDHFS